MCLLNDVITILVRAPHKGLGNSFNFLLGHILKLLHLAKKVYADMHVDDACETSQQLFEITSLEAVANAGPDRLR
jgi:hypothetical protein